MRNTLILGLAAITLVTGACTNKRKAPPEGSLPPIEQAPTKRKAINEAGALDFIYAADTIGGNSGSPVIDKDLNLLGANFDRNLPGLRNDYAYDLTMARSIAVSTAAIEQALKVIYPAPSLLAELHAR